MSYLRHRTIYKKPPRGPIFIDSSIVTEICYSISLLGIDYFNGVILHRMCNFKIKLCKIKLEMCNIKNRVSGLIIDFLV